MLLTREEILGRYELLDERDCSHIEINCCHSWGIYYKTIYIHIWNQKTEYGVTIWNTHKTELDTGITGADKYSVNKDGLFNILDRYLPRRKEIRLF